MREFGIVCLVALAAGGTLAAQDEPVFSGPQPGESLPPLKVRGVYGEAAGKELDFVERAGAGPVAIVFFQNRTRPAFGVMRGLLRYAELRKQEKDVQPLTLGVVFLTADPTETGNWLKQITRYFPEDAPVAISLEGAEGPGAYGLNRNVTLTVLVANKGKVTANFALVQPSEQADLPKILKEIVAVAGGEVPKLEELVEAYRQRPVQRPAAGLPPELAGKVRSLIQKDASEDDVERIARELEAVFEKQKDAGPQVGRIARRIIDAGNLDQYGTAKSREYLKKWADKYAPAKKEGRAGKLQEEHALERAKNKSDMDEP